MDALKHSAKDHSGNIVEDMSTKSRKKRSYYENQEEVEEEEEWIDADQYKCIKCNKIVLKADAFSNYKEDGQEWCSLCTILNYGDN